MAPWLLLSSGMPLGPAHLIFVTRGFLGRDPSGAGRAPGRRQAPLCWGKRLKAGRGRPSSRLQHPAWFPPPQSQLVTSVWGQRRVLSPGALDSPGPSRVQECCRQAVQWWQRGSWAFRAPLPTLPKQGPQGPSLQACLSSLPGTGWPQTGSEQPPTPSPGCICGCPGLAPLRCLTNTWAFCPLSCSLRVRPGMDPR